MWYDNSAHYNDWASKIIRNFVGYLEKKVTEIKSGVPNFKCYVNISLQDEFLYVKVAHNAIVSGII